jgi:hypothetical protein
MTSPCLTCSRINKLIMGMMGMIIVTLSIEMKMHKLRIVLMNDGNPPPLEPSFIPRLTRDTFLKEYQKIDAFPKCSEESVMAAVMDNLFKRHRE